MANAGGMRSCKLTQFGSPLAEVIESPLGTAQQSLDDLRSGRVCAHCLTRE